MLVLGDAKQTSPLYDTGNSLEEQQTTFIQKIRMKA